MLTPRIAACLCGFASVGLVTGCSNVTRSMLFFTGTTVGLEVSLEPGSTTPGKIVIGYKRAEGVLNPVYMETSTTDAAGTTTTTPSYRDDAYSVLAKIVGERGGGSQQTVSTGMRGAQWFATGAAATYLAQQPAPAAILTNAPEIAAEAATAAAYGGQLQASVLGRAMSEATAAHDFVCQLRMRRPRPPPCVSP